MSITVVAHLRDETRANSAIEDLMKQGFDHKSMMLISHERLSKHGKFQRELDGKQAQQSAVRLLTERDVPAKIAERYTEAVRRGGVLVVITADADRARGAKDALERFELTDVEKAESRWRREGWKGYDASAAPFAQAELEKERNALAEEHVDVVEEEVKVGKRSVERGAVRIRSYVTETPVHESVELREEHIHVDRQPVNERLSATQANAAFKEGEVELHERGEEAVVSKEARVVERVNVGKTVETHVQQVDETERRKDVKVERVGKEGNDVRR